MDRNDFGFGLINLSSFLTSKYFIKLNKISTFQNPIRYQLTVDKNNADLRIVMVYDDIPSSPFSNGTLINNLDLRVIHLDKNQYLKNLYQGNNAGFLEGDDVNNIEVVDLEVDNLDILLVEIASNGIIQSYPTFGQHQNFALIINQDFKEFSIINKCHEYSLTSQCFMNGHLGVRQCHDLKTNKFGDENNFCVNKTFELPKVNYEERKLTSISNELQHNLQQKKKIKLKIYFVLLYFIVFIYLNLNL